MLFLFFTFCFSICAQTDDFGTWWGVEIRKKFKNDIRLSLEVEARFNENSIYLRNIYVEPGISYKPLSWLRFGLQYRFDNRYQRGDDYFIQRHRISIDVGLEKTLKRWELEYRNRTQLNWDNYYDEDETYPQADNRNFFGVAFKWPQLPLRTLAAAEFWIPLTNDDHTPDRLRLTLAQEVTIHEKHRIQLRFLFQHNLDPSQPERQYILSTRYVFML